MFVVPPFRGLFLEEGGQGSGVRQKIIDRKINNQQSSFINPSSPGPQSPIPNPQSPIPNPKSEIRNPKSEIRNPKSEILPDITLLPQENRCQIKDSSHLEGIWDWGDIKRLDPTNKCRSAGRTYPPMDNDDSRKGIPLENIVATVVSIVVLALVGFLIRWLT